MQNPYDYEISTELGAKAYLTSWILEDSLKASGAGGIQSLVLGSFGTGKSTLLLRMAQQSRYLTKGSRDAYLHAIIKKKDKDGFKTRNTTVVWRCRDLDNWIVAIPANWKERCPGEDGKKVYLFIHKDDYEHITLFIYKDRQPVPVPNLPKPIIYNDAQDLVGKLKEGAFNAVVEPQKYCMSKTLADRIMRAKSQYGGEGPQSDDSIKDDIEEGMIPVKHKRGRPVKEKEVADYTQHLVKSGMFWIDVSGVAMASFGGRPIHFFWDECDDFLSQNQADLGWWSVQVHCESMRDFRKANISCTLTSHGFSLLHDAVYKRCPYRMYFPGVQSTRQTMVKHTKLFSGLHKGHFISEKTHEYYGLCIFPKIPDPIQCKIDGLQDQFPSLTEEQKTKIRDAYDKSWNRPEIIDIG